MCVCVCVCAQSGVLLIMSFGGGNKCPRCSKTVYMAEQVLAAGNHYHKMCCKCDECGKALDRYSERMCSHACTYDRHSKTDRN